MDPILEEELRAALRRPERPDFTFHVVDGKCRIRLNQHTWTITKNGAEYYVKGGRQKPMTQVATPHGMQFTEGMFA